MIQRSAARLCFKSYSKEPGEVTDMLNKLEWPSFEGRRILVDYQCFIGLFIPLLILTKICTLLLSLTLQGVVAPKPSQDHIQIVINMHSAFFHAQSTSGIDIQVTL